MENKVKCKKYEKEIGTLDGCGCTRSIEKIPTETTNINSYGVEIQFSYTTLESLLGLPPESLKEVYIDNRCDRVIFKLKTNQLDHCYINRNLIKLHRIIDGTYYYRHEI